MKVFISWSGERSRAVAAQLQKWLRLTIQACDPWVSVDIEKGARWSEAVSAQLEEAKVGIFCLTPENLNSRWLLFEAGALSKTADSVACTFLIGVHPRDIEQPLSQFQHTQVEQGDVFTLLMTINKKLEQGGGRALEEGLLKELFVRGWPELEAALHEIARRDYGSSSAAAPRRDDGAVLDELLDLARRNAEQLGALAVALEGVEAVTRVLERSSRVPYPEAGLALFENRGAASGSPAKVATRLGLRVGLLDEPVHSAADAARKLAERGG